MKASARLVPDYEVIVCAPEESFRWACHDYPWYLAKWNHHPEYELHLITATTGTMMVGDHIGGFGPGNLVLTGPNVPHNWVSNLAPGAVAPRRDMLVQFSADWASRVAGLCPEMSPLCAMFDEASFGLEFSGDTAREAATLLAEIGPSRGAARVLVFLSLMERLARDPADRRRLSRQASGDFARLPAEVDSAMRYIHEHFAEEIDLAAVADVAGLTPQTFSRVFKRQTGHTFASYLVLTRVYAACSTLTTTDVPVTEVCFDAGFNTIANFNRQFLKICGRTPSQYRRDARRLISEGRDAP